MATFADLPFKMQDLPPKRGGMADLPPKSNPLVEDITAIGGLVETLATGAKDLAQTIPAAYSGLYHAIKNQDINEFVPHFLATKSFLNQMPEGIQIGKEGDKISTRRTPELSSGGQAVAGKLQEWMDKTEPYVEKYLANPNIENRNFLMATIGKTSVEALKLLVPGELIGRALAPAKPSVEAVKPAPKIEPTFEETNAPLVKEGAITPDEAKLPPDLINKLYGGGPSTSDIVDPIKKIASQAVDTAQNLLDMTKRAGEVSASADSVGAAWYQHVKRADAVDVLTLKYAQQASEIVKANPNINLENISHWMEDPKGNTLLPDEKWFYDSIIKPLADNMDYEKGYIHRLAETHTPFMDKLKDGLQAMGKGNILSKVVPSSKGRVMMRAVNDATGESRVIAVKGNEIIGYDDYKQPSKIANFTKGTMEESLIKELKPLEAKLKDTESQIKLLEKLGEKMDFERPSGVSGLVTTGDKLIDLHELADRLTQQINDKYKNYDPATLKSKTFTDSRGQKFRIEDSTQKEIEQQTNVTYHKNALVQVLEDFKDQTKAQMAEKWIENMKNSSAFLDFATQDKANMPKGYKPTNLAQFRGWYMEPQLAETFNEIGRRLGQVESILDVRALNIVNRELANTLFIMPYWHMMNEFMFAVKNRGTMAWFDPRTYSTLKESLVKAYKMTNELSPEYMRLFTEKNMPLQYPRTLKGDLNQVYSELLGYPYEKANKYRQELQWSNRALWKFSDVMHLRDTLERQMWQEKGMFAGMSEDESLDFLHKHTPTYELPMQYKSLNLASHPNITFFMRYKFDVLKDFVNTTKELINPKSPIEERVRAVDMMTTLGILSLVAWPKIDEFLQKISGNSKAYMAAFGPLAIPRALTQVVSQGSPMPIIHHLFFWALGTIEILQQMATSKGLDFRTGKHIVKPEDQTFMAAATDRAIHFASTSPLMNELYQNPGWLNASLTQVGIFMPENKDAIDKKMEGVEKKIDNFDFNFNQKMKSTFRKMQ